MPLCGGLAHLGADSRRQGFVCADEDRTPGFAISLPSRPESPYRELRERGRGEMVILQSEAEKGFAEAIMMADRNNPEHLLKIAEVKVLYLILEELEKIRKK